MKYRSPTALMLQTPKKGDVWIIDINEFGEHRRIMAVIISASADNVMVKRLSCECKAPNFHLLYNPASAGLDYAEYMNYVPESAHINGLVRRIGHLSRDDRAFI